MAFANGIEYRICSWHSVRYYIDCSIQAEIGYGKAREIGRRETSVAL